MGETVAPPPHLSSFWVNNLPERKVDSSTYSICQAAIALRTHNPTDSLCLLSNAKHRHGAQGRSKVSKYLFVLHKETFQRFVSFPWGIILFS